MIRNAVGMLMTRIAVAATTKRTSQMLSARNWMIVGPNRTRTAISPTVSTSTTGRIEKISFPGRVRRDHVLDRVVIYLSTPPMIGSSEAMTAIVSAMRLLGIITPTHWSWKNEGSWIRIRNGWAVPSLIT